MRTDENLRGRTVISADGRAIGALVALLVDEVSWQVESIRIELNRDIAQEIGVRRSMFHKGTIEVPVRSIQSAGDAIVLSIPIEGLRASQVTEEQPRPVGAHEAPIH